MSGFVITHDIQGSVELIKAFHVAPDIVNEELVAATWEAELLLEREIKELTPVGVGAGGGLRGSISAREPRTLADNVIGVVGTSAAHALPVEIGTRPHFPPIEPLQDWVEAKLGVGDNASYGVAFMIARKIARRGTQGAHMFERAFEANRAQVQQIYARARTKIAKRMASGRGGAS